VARSSSRAVDRARGHASDRPRCRPEKSEWNSKDDGTGRSPDSASPNRDNSTGHPAGGNAASAAKSGHAAGVILAAQGYELSSGAEPWLHDYIERRRTQPHFANARSIRNAIDRARLRHAARLVDAGGTVDRDALRVILPDDLMTSRIFDAERTPNRPA